MFDLGFGSGLGAGLVTGLGAGFRVLTGGVSFSAFGFDSRLALIGARAGVLVSSAVDKVGAWGGGAGRIAAATSLTVGTSGTGFVFGVSLATSFLGLGLGSGCSGGGNNRSAPPLSPPASPGPADLPCIRS